MAERLSSLLRPSSVSFFPVPMVQLGPRTITGRQQRGAPDAGYWGAELGFELLDSDEILEWRGQMAWAQGGLNAFIVGVFDDQQSPAPEGVPLFTAGIPHSDGSLHSDGAGYSQSNVEVRLHSNMAEGAVAAEFDIVTAGPLKRGHYFSIEDRLSVITEPPLMISNSRASVKFWPPSRIAPLSDAYVEMARPRAHMEFADAKTGRLKLSGMWTGEPTLELVESFDGL